MTSATPVAERLCNAIAIRISTTIGGIVSTTFVMPISSSSSHPPRYPARVPMTRPTTVATNPATRPTYSDVRVP